MRERGFTMVEMLVVVAILMILGAAAAPSIRAYTAEAYPMGAGLKFKAEFLKARSTAVRSNRQTAIRFEKRADGADYYSVYADENHNGVLASDIVTGRDKRVAGPFPLDGGAPGVRVGINVGVPEIPPGRGLLDTTDPIRFGRSNMISFSPLGTASPGTFYVANQWVQVAVRVVAETGRVRLFVCHGTKWVER